MPTSQVRKSGNSTVLVLPPEYVKQRELKIGEEVGFEVFRNVDLKPLLGRGRHLKLDAQKAKNELRKEW